MLSLLNLGNIHSTFNCYVSFKFFKKHGAKGIKNKRPSARETGSRGCQWKSGQAERGGTVPENTVRSQPPARVWSAHPPFLPCQSPTHPFRHCSNPSYSKKPSQLPTSQPPRGSTPSISHCTCNTSCTHPSAWAAFLCVWHRNQPEASPCQAGTRSLPDLLSVSSRVSTALCNSRYPRQTWSKNFLSLPCRQV